MTNIDTPKYNAIITTGKSLFYKHGYKRVSVDEICRTAKVSKMTFYRFFDNKLHLAKTVFTDAVNHGCVQFSNILKSGQPPTEIMKQFIAMKINGMHDISQEFLNDFYFSGDNQLNSFISQTTENAWSIIINDFKQAQQQGIFRNDFKPEVLFNLAYKMADMFNDPKVKQLYKNNEELMHELTKLMVYGIVNNNNG